MNWTKNKPTSSAATVVCAAISQSLSSSKAGFTAQNLDGAYSLYKMVNPEGVEYETSISMADFMENTKMKI
ncbi:hypothetical protein KOZ92_00590 [Streptococcus pneumoniae]|nr:hypothetical protein [Streptococcus pneumoniae]